MRQPQSLVEVWALWLGTGAASFATGFFLLGWPWQFDLAGVVVCLAFACAATYGFRHGQFGPRNHDREDSGQIGHE
jgi:membrane protein implicated in regulation of membrane protease activity